MARLMQHAAPEESHGRLDELVATFRARYLPHMLDQTRPYLGIVPLLEELGTRPDHVAFVGDTRTDMKTANNAGMLAVGVLWGFRDEEELRANGADRLIARPDQLLELLG